MNQSIKRAFLDTEDGQILYRIGGQGPSLLLLHMTPRSSDEFREIMPILMRQRQVVAMDLMGLGDSDKPPRTYSVADYANTVIELWDRLGIQKSSLFGSLTGGYIAAEVAAAYPERVEKLILGNVFRFDIEEIRKIFNKNAMGFNLKEDGSHLTSRWFARFKAVGGGELNNRCILDDLKCVGSPLYPGIAVANYLHFVKERFRSIECPTLILSGDKGLEQLQELGLAKGENQNFVLQAIPQSQEIKIKEGTLWMNNQIPEKIANFILEFID